MDFSFSEEADAAGDLARQILEGQVTQDRLKELEQGRAPYDERTWAELAKAGLLGLALPEEVGVAGRGLVPARTEEDTVGVFLLDTGAQGVKVEREDTTSGIPEARLELAGAEVADRDVLGDPAGGAGIVAWMAEAATAATCAVMCGVCQEALRLTAEYTKTREQFDRAIATFQAVSQRAADAYIDTEAIRLTGLQAAWRLSAGLPAAEAVAVAKFWAAEGGQRVVHAAQHLHGGIGVDRDYPLHRYFLWAKHLELTLGGATPQLLRLGSMLAAEPV